MRRWRTRVGSVALLMAVACVIEVDDSRGAEWYPTSASASLSVGSAGSTGEAQDTDTGGEDEAPTTGDPKDPDGTTGDPTPDPASTTSPGPSETSGPGGSSGDPVLDACLDVAANDCEMCGCTQCLDTLHACELDPGCVQIRECAQQAGCTDATSCYEACEDVINANGGAFGDSAALAAELADCMETSCPVCS